MWLGGTDSNPDKQSQSLIPPPDSDLFHLASLQYHGRLADEAPSSKLIGSVAGDAVVTQPVTQGERIRTEAERIGTSLCLHRMLRAKTSNPIPVKQAKNRLLDGFKKQIFKRRPADKQRRNSGPIRQGNLLEKQGIFPEPHNCY